MAVRTGRQRLADGPVRPSRYREQIRAEGPSIDPGTWSALRPLEEPRP
ncbi:MAG: hypothetical protein F6K44_07105 [Moorea sp. SIO3E2]|nr:hypothetical protein [Moorena sp. SIO3E2]